MKQELCPGLDQAWYGLITDLDQRGLLDDTLVVCTSEHGRTPKITTRQGGGRDHWSRVYSSLVAGGGTKRGHVVGASDKQGGDVAERPISPKDLLATMYHLLGIDHHMMVHDALGRPLPLVDGAGDSRSARVTAATCECALSSQRSTLRQIAERSESQDAQHFRPIAARVQRMDAAPGAASRRRGLAGAEPAQGAGGRERPAAAQPRRAPRT